MGNPIFALKMAYAWANWHPVSIPCNVRLLADVEEKVQEEKKRNNRMRHAEQSKAFLASIVEFSQDAILSLDLDGTITTWNAAAENIYGYTAKESVGKHVSITIPEKEREQVMRRIHKVHEGETVKPFEAERRHKSGAVLCLSISISPIKDESGRVIGVSKVSRDITERKRMERELHESLDREQAAHAEAETARAHFRSLFESAPGLYLVLEPNEFRIVAVSEAYLRATLTKREEIVGRTMFEVFPDPPSDPYASGVKNLRGSLERVREKRIADVMAVQRYPIRLPAKQGGGWEERYWSPLNSPVFGARGELAYIIHRAEDVTEYVREKQQQGTWEEGRRTLEARAQHMEAEIVLRAHELQRLNEQLRHSEQRLQTIFNQAGAGIVETDLNGRIRFMNKRYCDIVGRGCDELLQLGMQDLTHKDDLPRNLELLQKLVAGGPDFEIEKRYVRPDGSVVWVQNTVCLVRDSAGAPSYLVALTQDITDRKNAEKAWRESEERFRLIVENVKDFAIFTFDFDGRIDSWNPGAEGVFGYSQDEILGRNVDELYSPQDRAANVPKRERENSYRDDCATNETWHVRKNGERFYVSGAVRPLRDEFGRVRGFAKVARDITALKSSEESLRELTGHLLQLQDHERRRIGRDLHDSTAQSLAALEMNLAVITRAPSFDDRCRRLLEESRRLAEQSVTEIRTLSYLLHPPLLDELGLVSAIKWYVTGFSERSGIKVNLSLPEHYGRLSDEVELALFRIVQESLSNVHRHSGSQRAWLRIHHEDGKIILEIEDEGTGFFPANLQSTENKAIVGVGLVGMRERVRQLGGTFEISSNSGGTIVRVMLPA